MTSSYKKGLMYCDRIFHIPRQYKIQTPTANTTEEGRTALIALCYSLHLQMPEITAAQSLYLHLHKSIEAEASASILH